MNIITAVALVVLVYLIRHQIIDTFKNLSNVDGRVLLLMIPMQMLNYHSQTKLYKGLFELVGNKLSYKHMYRTALEMNFINNVFPSGGVSGISYFGMRMRNNEITGGRATIIQIMKLMLYFVSFEFLLITGLVFLAASNHANNLIILIASSFTTLLIIGTFAFVMIIGDQHRINSTFTFLTRVVNRLVYIFRRNSPEAISIARVEHAFNELHINYKTIESRWRDLKWPLFWAFVANLTEVLTIYIVYIAFGQWVNIGAVILAYSVANFSGLLSVLPGGVGVYEALMTAVLVATGIPARLSLPVTVMYRVLNMLIQIPPGWFFYHATLRERSAIEAERRS